MTTKRSLTVAAFAILSMLGQSAAAYAADVRVLCSLGLKSVMEELAPQFERTSGHKVIVEYGLAAQYKQQIEGGKDFDLAVLTPAHIDDLIKQSRIAADSRTVIARTGLGLMIRSGGRKPDVSSTEAFKRALVAAKAIAFAKEGASGVAFVATVEKLGMTEALKSKFKATGGGEEVNALVVKGEADFGVLPLSEILGVQGTELGGMFPAEVQTFITMAGGVSSKARQGVAARDLLKFLASPGVLAAIKAKGMERG
jgi:molybdate transport system substrate-binding protein